MDACHRRLAMTRSVNCATRFTLTIWCLMTLVPSEGLWSYARGQVSQPPARFPQPQEVKHAARLNSEPEHQYQAGNHDQAHATSGGQADKGIRLLEPGKPIERQ